jgi:hypothetical protein
MKSAILHSILGLLLLLAAPARAAVSITVNSNGGSPFADSSGTILADGSVVRVGYFDTAALGVLNTLQTSTTYSEISALFTPLAEGLANAGTVSQAGTVGTNLVINSLSSPGAIFGSITGISSSYLTPGVDLAVWVFNSSNPLTASEWGIFSATTRVGANWDFPFDLGSSVLSTFEINNVIRGTDTGTQFRLAPVVAPVPEPGGSLLILAAGILFGRRRTRRQTSI